MKVITFTSSDFKRLQTLENIEWLINWAQKHKSAPFFCLVALIQFFKVWVKKWAKKAKKLHHMLLMDTMVALTAGKRVKMALVMDKLSKILSFYCKNFFFYYFSAIIKLQSNFFRKYIITLNSFKVWHRVRNKVLAN